MNKRQKAAINSLELAFKECANVGLILANYDGVVHAFRSDALQEALAKLNGDILEAMQITMQREEDYAHVESHSVMPHVGGW